MFKTIFIKKFTGLITPDSPSVLAIARYLLKKAVFDIIALVKTNLLRNQSNQTVAELGGGFWLLPQLEIKGKNMIISVPWFSSL